MRTHSGGFINEEHIWDIGSPTRGRDGDNARDASKKYNDHRHSAILFTDGISFAEWITERESPVLVGPNNSVEGGIITNNPAALIRRHGDLAYFGGILWMFDGSGVVPVGKNGVSFDINTKQIVYSLSSVEFAFNSYQILSLGQSVENASSQRLIGTVVIDYSQFSEIGCSYEVTLDIVGSINPSLLQTSTLYTTFQGVFDEQGSLPLYVTLLTTLQIMSNGGRFNGRDMQVDNATVILNAYSDIGDESITKDLDFIQNAKVKYSMYLKRPTKEEFLARYPDIELTNDQKIELDDIIGNSEVQLSKASIRVTTVYNGA